MSLINAISMAHYTVMANNAAYNMMQASNARMDLLSGMGANNISFGSLDSLHEADTQLELNMLTNSLQYQMAKAMLENLKKQQQEENKHLNVFA